MREIHVAELTAAVARLVQEANFVLEADVQAALAGARRQEAGPTGQAILLEIIENADLAAGDRVPMCQDTGTVIVFLTVGQAVHFVGGDLKAAINAGVARGYREGLLRMSMLRDPIDRVNSKDNTPAMIHIDLVPGDQVHLVLDCKGGGAENMSRLAMLKPSDGWEGVRQFVIDTVARAGPNACPPLIVGVGIGGNFERCALLAKGSLLRPVGAPNPDPAWAAREQELLAAVNALGVGPMGLGGTVTALAVHIDVMGCHIAALPVAVNIECHSHRHKSITL